jgi:hypothetical protein
MRVCLTGLSGIVAPAHLPASGTVWAMLDRYAAASVFALGESDCEMIGDGFLKQPVNAVSSLAFSVVGVAIWAWAARAHGRERRFRIVLGAGLVATGVGSFLFHGPQTAGAGFLHDITFLTVLLTIGVGNLGAVIGWSERATWSVATSGVIAAAVILILEPTATNVLLVAALVVIAASEVAIQRTEGGDGRWYAATLALVFAAVVLFVLGRTGSFACEPDSYRQWHAAWHVVIAAAAGAYAVATSPARLRAQAP